MAYCDGCARRDKMIERLTDRNAELAVLLSEARRQLRQGLPEHIKTLEKLCADVKPHAIHVDMDTREELVAWMDLMGWLPKS